MAIALETQAATIEAMVRERPELEQVMLRAHPGLVSSLCESVLYRVILQTRGYLTSHCAQQRRQVPPNRALACAKQYWACRACDPTGELPCPNEGPGECRRANTACLSPLSRR